MRIVRVELQHVGGAFAAPVANARHAWARRGGALVRLIDEDGRAGVGELAPLPDHSPDTLADGLRALAGLDLAALALDLTAPLAPQLRGASGRIPAALPAARAALEGAILDLAGRRAGRPAWALLGGRPGRVVPLAALVDDEASARRALARGVRTLKRKIGRPGDVDAVLALRRVVGDDVAIRVDANGALSLAEAPEILAALAAAGVELVEEPVTPHDLPRLGRAPLPIALDESLASTDAEVRIDAGLADVVVLKPALIGGVVRGLDLAARAARRGARALVSHLFDGPVGLATAAALALALPEEPLACGLAPHAGLAAWPAAEIAGLGEAALAATDAPGLGVRFAGEGAP